MFSSGNITNESIILEEALFNSVYKVLLILPNEEAFIPLSAE